MIAIIRRKNFKGFKYFQIYCYRITLDYMKALNVGLSHHFNLFKNNVNAYNSSTNPKVPILVRKA